MYDSVRSIFPSWSAKFESSLPWMYLDNDGAVTTAIGNKIDSIGEAQAFPWKNTDGSLSSPDQIAADWTAVKNSGKQGTGGGNQANLSSIRLDQAGIAAVVARKMDDDESLLKQRISNWESLTATAQLATLGMAWALGPEFDFPTFLSDLNRPLPDFQNAAFQAWMRDTKSGRKPVSIGEALTWTNNSPPPDLNWGLRPRNMAILRLFLQAAQTVANGAPLDDLAGSVPSVSPVVPSDPNQMSPATKVGLPILVGGLVTLGFAGWYARLKGWL